MACFHRVYKFGSDRKERWERLRGAEKRVDLKISENQEAKQSSDCSVPVTDGWLWMPNVDTSDSGAVQPASSPDASSPGVPNCILSASHKRIAGSISTGCSLTLLQASARSSKKICDHLSLTIEGRIGKIDACLSLAISVITNTYRGGRHLVPRTILSSSVPRAETSTLSMLTSSTMPARCSGAIVMSVLVPCWPPKCPTSATPVSLPVDHPRA